MISNMPDAPAISGIPPNHGSEPIPKLAIWRFNRWLTGAQRYQMIFPDPIRSTERITKMMMSIEDLILELKISRCTIYRIIKRDGFPAPRKYGRSSRWVKREVEQFILNQIKDA